MHLSFRVFYALRSFSVSFREGDVGLTLAASSLDFNTRFRGHNRVYVHRLISGCDQRLSFLVLKCPWSSPRP
ncbi:unnamed protein product [Phytomonas sp. EM1]|nr:unnamed protein product [Phytomonas sp. EM1]|eukprot:CCW63651.1 unnamed protein product [Phytomonas sp. isolate EM1]